MMKVLLLLKKYNSNSLMTQFIRKKILKGIEISNQSITITQLCNSEIIFFQYLKAVLIIGNFQVDSYHINLIG